MSQKTYTGLPSGQVWVLDRNGGRLLSDAIRFGWGHTGSAAYKLAAAILLDATNDPVITGILRIDFVEEVVAGWEHRQQWQITSKEIEDWILKRCVPRKAVAA